jgi:hypothetical protein
VRPGAACRSRRGAAVAASTRVDANANCNRRDGATLVFGRAGSAGGPKPGRNSFSFKLGSGSSRPVVCLGTASVCVEPNFDETFGGLSSLS